MSHPITHRYSRSRSPSPIVTFSKIHMKQIFHDDQREAKRREKLWGTRAEVARKFHEMVDSYLQTPID